MKLADHECEIVAPNYSVNQLPKSKNRVEIAFRTDRSALPLNDVYVRTTITLRPVLADLFFVLCRGCFVVYANRIPSSYFSLSFSFPFFFFFVVFFFFVFFLSLSLCVAGWRRKRRGCGRAEIHGG